MNIIMLIVLSWSCSKGIRPGRSRDGLFFCYIVLDWVLLLPHCRCVYCESWLFLFLLLLLLLLVETKAAAQHSCHML